MILPVILSGGSGTRLWPLSRELYPKQFLPLVEERTMLQATLGHLDGLSDVLAPIVVCNEQHRFLVAQQLQEIGLRPSAIILEPVGRNTAPAAAVAALQAMADGSDPLLLVLPADHVIADLVAFQTAAAKLIPYAGDGRLATFGIVPTQPETGYGYIQAGAGCEESIVGSDPRQIPPASVFRVERFVEKPNLETARQYVASGEYYWNSGMFLFRASRFLQELERFAPDILDGCRKSYAEAVRDLDFVRLHADAFAVCRGESIDYAIMEKTGDAVVVPLEAGWSDVGSWSALWDVGERDDDGNVVQGDVLCVGSQNSYIFSGHRLVAAVGLEDAVVVETTDAVLVARKDRVQEVKVIVEKLKSAQREEAMAHRRVCRPWGTYECIDRATRFQVKRITVNPGASLSLQLHHHRAEHWVVVSGTAMITRGEEKFVLSENQSTYIPLGVAHRLENPGKIPLELIEVQSGSYLGEDDIVRFEDRYGR